MRNPLFQTAICSFLLFTIFSCADKNKSEKSHQTDRTTEEAQAGKIKLENLPPAINEYLLQNYPGYRIGSANHDPLCEGGDAIDVFIYKKENPNFSLIFLPDGTFVQQEEDIELDQAPLKILESLNAHFDGYVPSKQIEKLVLADQQIQYLLDISKDNKEKEVIFKENGTVVCESKD